MVQCRFYHEQYSVFQEERGTCLYDNNPIIRLTMKSFSGGSRETPSIIDILCRNKQHYSWETKYAHSGYIGQFGIAVRNDGGAVFLQDWDLGLRCHDVKTGNPIWWKRSRYTNLFVMENTLVCHKPYKSLQMLDIHTGELLKERSVDAWGFTALNHRYIICETKISERCHQWEIIRAATLETVQTVSHKELTLTDNHPHYHINRIVLEKPGVLHVSGYTDRSFFSIKNGSQTERFSTVIPCMDLSK